MKCFLIEVRKKGSNYFDSKVGERFFWAGVANNAKPPKIYLKRKDAERVLRSTNTYLCHDEKRIVEAELTIGEDGQWETATA